MAKMTAPAQTAILEPVPGVARYLFFKRIAQERFDRISRPVTGAYFWCPPILDGRLDLRQLGL